MRIVSYNILDGGEGRADPLAEVIQAQRPDVVGLVEAEFAPVVERIASRLGMDFVTGLGNSARASALLSRWPIAESINHAALRPDMSKSLLEATVLVPDLGPVVFGVLHLHHYDLDEDERQREGELAAVLDAFDIHRRQGHPHVLMGDFNASSPHQRIDPSRLRPEVRRHWDANGGSVPRRAIQTMLDAGYVDTFQHRVGAVAQGTFCTRYPELRVDYIFTHGIDPARLSAAWIETDRLARYASDHFPVGAEIATSGLRGP
jgi:endonuclease/exonuclease/phosphatase family metal-dependent hydrolase